MSRLLFWFTSMAVSFAQRFKDIASLVDYTVSRVEADANTSPALKAVVEEFRDKAQMAVPQLTGASERTMRDLVIEVEQAADSAKKAAQADTGISSATRQAILEAHGAMCALKSELLELMPS
jgi:hypothetical protein